jgi:hypothetical protein
MQANKIDICDIVQQHGREIHLVFHATDRNIALQTLAIASVLLPTDHAAHANYSSALISMPQHLFLLQCRDNAHYIFATGALKPAATHQPIPALSNHAVSR